MWWPGVGWPDIRGLNEANCSREQQLWIRELFRRKSRQAVHPSAVERSWYTAYSCTVLVRPNWVICSSQLSVIASDGPYTFVCARFCRKISYSCSPLSKPPPSPLQCTSRGRSCIGASSCQTSTREKTRDPGCPVSRALECGRHRSFRLSSYVVLFGQFSNIHSCSLTVISHLAISRKGNGSPNCR